MSGIADHYSYRVRWSDEDGECVGTVAEFPGLSWLDDSPVDALIGIQRVAAECAEDMLQSGEEPPQPYSTREYSGKFVVRIPPPRNIGSWRWKPRNRA